MVDERFVELQGTRKRGRKEDVDTINRKNIELVVIKVMRVTK